MSNYPDGADFRLCRLVMDRVEPRDLTSDEAADIATLREAIAIAEDAASRLRSIPRHIKAEHTPNDVARELTWNVAQLKASIRDIERLPEAEAEQLELEGF